MFFVVLLDAGHALSDSTEFIDDIVVLNARSADGMQIDVKIKTVDYSSSFPYKQGFRWGTTTNKPKKLISMLSVKLDGKEFYIPFSVYSDLTNPKLASVNTNKDEFIVEIKGGDAASAYTARLYFNKNTLKRKKVSHNEFPKEAWEETIYSFNIN
jgi:hypothetical protein